MISISNQYPETILDDFAAQNDCHTQKMY